MKWKKIMAILVMVLSIFYFSEAVASRINFDFYTYKGQKSSLQDYRGKYVLLNLFASYCSICMAELKTLNKLNHTCHSDDYKIISLLVDKEGIPALPEIVNANKLTYTIGIAPSKLFQIFPDFSITPTTYILNKNGELIRKVVGYKGLKDWIKILNRYISCN